LVSQVLALGLTNGGFDPVAVPATVADTIEIVVTTPEGERIRTRVTVPYATLPIIVRTDPPKRKRDVPIGIALSIIFSEPVDPFTISHETIQLYEGDRLVDGEVRFVSESNLAVEFLPTAPLEPATDYRLVITTGVRDLAGDPLLEVTEVLFTTAGQPAFTSVSAGLTHTCALTRTGRAYCWGNGTLGQLGSDVSGSTLPRPVNGDHRFVQVSAGGRHTCAVSEHGQAFCWGWNGMGQLGDASFESGHIPTGVAGGLAFTSISAGYDHTCGVTSTGQGYCWGNNEIVPDRYGWDPFASPTTGKLGIRTDRYHLLFNTPVLMSAELSFWTVAAGDPLSCGATAEGSIYCWGVTNAVQDEYPFEALTGSVVGLVAADAEVVALSVGGSSLTWLDGNQHIRHWGYLAAETFGARAYCGNFGTVISRGLTFTDQAGGRGHICGIAADGTAHCFGFNQYGQFGNGSTWSGVYRAFDDINSGPWHPTAGGLRFTSLSAARTHTCGVTSDGHMYCWGINTYGQLGDGTTSDRLVPVRVGGQE
jgi:alpha-tubulin suppressor-like RCC1 family protein